MKGLWLFRSVLASSILFAFAAIVAWLFYLSATTQYLSATKVPQVASPPREGDAIKQIAGGQWEVKSDCSDAKMEDLVEQTGEPDSQDGRHV